MTLDLEEGFGDSREGGTDLSHGCSSIRPCAFGIASLNQHIGADPNIDRIFGSFFWPCADLAIPLLLREILHYNIKIQTFTINYLLITLKRKEKVMKNLCNIIAGPVGVITGLAVLTLTILEIREKIQMKRMRKEHIASQQPNNPNEQ